MSRRRRRKKIFTCNHKGFGKYCHRCWQREGVKKGRKPRDPDA